MERDDESFLQSISYIPDMKIVEQFVYTIILYDILSGNIRVDEYGIYTTISRFQLANRVGVSTSTISKYIKILQRKGFIKDVRQGLHKNNKIYITDMVSLGYIRYRNIGNL